MAAPQRAVRREARHPGHQRRRPDRRRRPDQGRRGPHPRRPGDRALRPGAAHQPRHLRHQRAARPRRADPGRRCSTCWRSATSRSAATSCGCRSTCCWSRAPTPRTTPTAAASSPRSRTGSAPRSAPTTRCELDDELALDPPGGRRWPARRARPPARGRRPLHPARARVAGGRRRAPASPRGSRSPPPRPSPRRRCAGRRSPARTPAVARVCDLPGRRADACAARSSSRSARRAASSRCSAHLLRRATVETFRATSAALDLSALHRALRRGRYASRPATWCPAAELLEQVGPVPGLAHAAGPARRRRGRRDARARGRRAGVRAGGAVPQPRGIAKDDGVDAAAARLRQRLTDAATAATATARGTTGRTRSPPPYDVRRALDGLGDDVLAGVRAARRAARPAAPRRLRRAGAGSTTCSARSASSAGAAARARPARRHAGGGPRAARHRRSARSARRCSRTRPTTPASARPTLDALPGDTGAGRPRARRLRLALARGGRDLRADPGPAAPRGAGQPVPRHEAGAGGRRPGGHAAGQGHAGRPQRRCSRPTRAASTRRSSSTSSWSKYGDFFPDNPQNLDELVDSLARRAAAAERMMALADAGAARRAGRR